MKQLGPEHQIGRVVAQYRGKYRVTSQNKEFWAEVAGRVRYAANATADYPVVGDLVNIIELGLEHAVIDELLPRQSIIERRAAGKDESQPIAANVDTAFIIQSVDRDFNLNRFERYLTIVRSAKIKPVLVMNKCDLITPDELNDKMALMKNRFKDIPILTTSSLTGDGIDPLKSAIVPGQIHCLLGSSGVGKSSIINRLLGKELLKTLEISAQTKKGKHTTTHRELFVLDNGGMIIDNPGMREIGLAAVGGAVGEVFGDISALAGECKFSDCTHKNETGCAVLAAVSAGRLSESQYLNFLKLKKESDFYALSSLEKRRKDRSFGRMVKNAKKQIKRGG